MPITDEVKAIRERLQSEHEEIGRTLTDPALTQQAKNARALDAFTASRDAALGDLDGLRESVQAEVDRTQAALDEARAVPPEQMATAATVLGPALSRAADKPDALVNLYREKFDDHASRRLLEEQARALAHVLPPNEANLLAEGFRRTAAENDDRIDPDERDARAELDAASRTAGYLADVRRAIDYDLQLPRNSGNPGEVLFDHDQRGVRAHRALNEGIVSAQTARWRAAQYEQAEAEAEAQAEESVAA